MIANSDDGAKPQEVSTSLKILPVSNLTAFSNAKPVDSKVPGGPMVPSRQVQQATPSSVVQAVPVAAQSTGTVKPAIDRKAPVAAAVPSSQIRQATTSPVVQAVPVAAHSTETVKPAIDSKAPVVPMVPTRHIRQAPTIPTKARPVMVNQNKNTPAISSKPAVGVAANSNPTKP